ncbi:MAG: glycosyltransferase family 2 protein [Candidatus Melainabacteria bacterium]|nr:glycosyltransferase family 2 protein [Candidatus Melainabacteria bacterium]
MSVWAPLVSVIIPFHGEAEYLLEAVASVEAQTYRNIELIIVDDSSVGSDWDKLVMGREACTIPTRVLRHASRSGAAAARNTAIRNSTGELILPLDSDDLLDPVYVEETVKVLNDVECGAAYTDLKLFGEQSLVLRPDCSLINILAGKPAPVCMLYRRDMYESVGGYKEHLEVGEDSDFCISALRRGWRFKHTDRAMYYYRKHSRSTSALRYAEGGLELALNIFQEHKEIYLEHLEEILRLKEQRYWHQKEEYAYLHREFHLLLKGYYELLHKRALEQYGVKTTLTAFFKAVANRLARQVPVISKVAPQETQHHQDILQYE